jgi:hypothetical protein
MPGHTPTRDAKATASNPVEPTEPTATSKSLPMRSNHIILRLSQLKGAVEQQPISVCVDAGNWGLYRGGVFNQCGQGINHAVTLVGYNDEGWIVKNSWDTNWGETGYIRLSPGNTCGILGYAVYPN